MRSSKLSLNCQYLTWFKEFSANEKKVMTVPGEILGNFRRSFSKTRNYFGSDFRPQSAYRTLGCVSLVSKVFRSRADHYSERMRHLELLNVFDDLSIRRPCFFYDCRNQS